jgi:hypothetical protein
LEPTFFRKVREQPYQLRQIQQFFLSGHNAQIFHDRHLHLNVWSLPSPKHQRMAANHPSLALI